jgi:hypothetical protein
MALKQVTFQATVKLTVEEAETADMTADTAARRYLEAGAEYMNAAHDAGSTHTVTFITGWRKA